MSGYDDGTIELRNGPHQSIDAGEADLAIVDPPYGDTGLAWDQLAVDWLETVDRSLAPHGTVWLWGSMRSLAVMLPAATAGGWSIAQDVVWEKHNGSGLLADRFRRVHEQAVHLYRGPWADTFHDPQVSHDAQAKTTRRKQKPTHWGKVGEAAYESIDGGPRLLRSVMYERSAHGSAIHPTQKPLGITMTLIRYSCPPNGLVISPYAGSGTDLLAARLTGRRAIGTEVDAAYCAAAVDRLTDDARRPSLFGAQS